VRVSTPYTENVPIENTVAHEKTRFLHAHTRESLQLCAYHFLIFHGTLFRQDSHCATLCLWWPRVGFGLVAVVVGHTTCETQRRRRRRCRCRCRSSSGRGPNRTAVQAAQGRGNQQRHETTYISTVVIISSKAAHTATTIRSSFV
jgi:hypothetical protein